MDYLMRFSIYCKENSIETFVDSLTDFNELVKIKSPCIDEFMETCLNETERTKVITKVLWSEAASVQTRVSFVGPAFGNSYLSPSEV